MTGDPGPTGGRCVDPGQDLQQRRLAGAGRTDDGDHLAAVHQQVETLQRLHLDGVGLVDPQQVVADDQRVVAELARALDDRLPGRLGSAT